MDTYHGDPITDRPSLYPFIILILCLIDICSPFTPSQGPDFLKGIDNYQSRLGITVNNSGQLLRKGIPYSGKIRVYVQVLRVFVEKPFHLTDPILYAPLRVLQGEVVDRLLFYIRIAPCFATCCHGIGKAKHKPRLSKFWATSQYRHSFGDDARNSPPDGLVGS